MKIRTTTLIFMLLMSLVLCVNQKSYADSLIAYLDEPYPTNQKDIDEECTWIRSEIAYYNNLVPSYNGYLYESSLIVARRNIAELESRAAILKCGAAFSSTQIIENQNPRSSIDECIKACKEHTNWSSEQCFDKCR